MSTLTCTGRRHVRQQAQMVVPYKYQSAHNQFDQTVSLNSLFILDHKSEAFITYTPWPSWWIAKDLRTAELLSNE